MGPGSSVALAAIIVDRNSVVHAALRMQRLVAAQSAQRLVAFAVETEFVVQVLNVTQMVDYPVVCQDS